MHSIYFRNFLATAALVLLSFLLLAFSFVYVGRNIFVDDVREEMESNAQEVARAASAYAEFSDLQSFDLRMMLTSIASSTGRHIFLTSSRGYVVTCSDRTMSCRHIGMQIHSVIMQQLYDNGELMSFSNLDGFYDGEYYVVALPFMTSAGAVAGYVFVAQDSSSALNTWRTVLPLFLLICVVVLLLALIFSFFSLRHLSRPLHALADAARKFGHGDLTVRVDDMGREDELGELADAFNNMAASLEKSEVKRREFIANVSHELKTPMTTIAGFADGILDGTIPPEQERKYLQTISAETKRLSRLVRSMLELSRLQSEEKGAFSNKSFDIAEVLRLTLINFADKINERRLDVDFQVPEDPVLVMGDSDSITQVVYNLMDNAVKFSRENTSLGVSLWKDDLKAYVSVRNTGETIPEAEIPLLFDRFHKTDRSRSLDRDGVGLGLYIVKTILNNHGEDIAVTSRNGVTDFVFTLTLK